MTDTMFRVEPLPGKDGQEIALVATSKDGENWVPIPTPFPSRDTAEKFIELALEGYKKIDEYQKKNPPYIYPRRLLN